MHNKHKVKMEKVEEMNRKVDRKLQELTRIANNEPSPFLDYLGLKISIAKETPYEVSCIISFLGLRNHTLDSNSSCEISVDTSVYPKGEYRITNCSPEISGDKIKHLEKCVNKTGDLCGLFVNLRKVFQAFGKGEN